MAVQLCDYLIWSCHHCCLLGTTVIQSLIQNIVVAQWLVYKTVVWRADENKDENLVVVKFEALHGRTKWTRHGGGPALAGLLGITKTGVSSSTSSRKRKKSWSKWPQQSSWYWSGVFPRNLSRDCYQERGSCGVWQLKGRITGQQKPLKATPWLPHTGQTSHNPVRASPLLSVLGISPFIKTWVLFFS